MTREPTSATRPWHSNVRTLRPMLATLQDAPLQGDHLVYEPKYDGIRALIDVEPGAGGIHIWSRLGNEKTSQFPEIVRALERFARKLEAPVVLDGEIVALDEHGQPAGFQKLQRRIHLSDSSDGASEEGANVAFIAFDLLRDGPDDLCSSRLTTRRERLERVFGESGSRLLRLSDFVVGDGRALYEMAMAQGWEGVIAKQIDSHYQAGRRTPDWRKLKIVRRQEFLVCGWTDPRASRTYFGALLLGVYEKGRDSHSLELVYAGHTGSGFDHQELARVSSLLKNLEIVECPFRVRPRTNQRPHWVEPKLVAEIKFTEWTADNKLRHPIYLGLRDDIAPETIRREPSARLHELSARRVRPASPGPRATVSAAAVGARSQTRPPATPHAVGPADLDGVIVQLDDIQARGGDGLLRLPSGHVLKISHLKKPYWPALKITKGDLLRYYVRVSPFLLPALADRPLVMKRYPDGVQGQAFYQQRAPEPVPDGVRVETVASDADVPARLIGGSLVTLLYMTQIAAISQDPWFSRVGSPDAADYVAIDLDPMPDVPFAKVLDVARWVHDELDHLQVDGFPKTSGADGLHIYIPLPSGTPYEAGLIFCQIVATLVARKHPRQATIERSLGARGRTVYVDYLQNIRGKTLATAYSARSSDYAGASTPLTWAEIDAGVAREDFTIRTLPDRLRGLGDVWAGLRTAKGVDLRGVEQYAKAEKDQKPPNRRRPRS